MKTPITVRPFLGGLLMSDSYFLVDAQGISWGSFRKSEAEHLAEEINKSHQILSDFEELMELVHAPHDTGDEPWITCDAQVCIKAQQLLAISHNTPTTGGPK